VPFTHESSDVVAAGSDFATAFPFTRALLQVEPTVIPLVTNPVVLLAPPFAKQFQSL
jgi:hypothetical protein